MTKLTDLNRANEALPAKNVRCHHQNINPEQLCYVCKGENDVVDSLGSVHLEVDVEAMALELAKAVFGDLAKTKESVSNALWLDYMNFAKHLSTTEKQWARLVRK